MEQLDDLKREVFFQYMAMAGRVYVVARDSDEVKIGNRGFSESEKESGLTLVINDKMKFTWDDYALTATLVFGANQEKCYIPIKDIVAVFSPELNSQFLVSPMDANSEELSDDNTTVKSDVKFTVKSSVKSEVAPIGKISDKKPTIKTTKGSKIIKVDFNKKHDTDD